MLLTEQEAAGRSLRVAGGSLFGHVGVIARRLEVVVGHRLEALALTPRPMHAPDDDGDEDDDNNEQTASDTQPDDQLRVVVGTDRRNELQTAVVGRAAPDRHLLTTSFTAFLNHDIFELHISLITTV